MSWVRDIRSDTSAVDSMATGQAARGYLWESDTPVDPTSLAMYPQTFLGGDTGVEPLPPRGSAHPIIPSFKLDTYTVRCDGRTQQITALYSNDGRFNFPPPNDDTESQLGVARYSSSTEEVRIAYPFARRMEQEGALAVGQVGPQLPVLLQYGEKYLSESQRRWTWDVLIKEQEIDAAEVAMDTQHNNIHFIRSRYWRFQSAPVNYHTRIGDEHYYRISYTWLGDRGTADNVLAPLLPHRGPIGSTGNYAVYFPQPSVGVGTSLPGSIVTRKPFHIFTRGSEITVSGEPHPVFLQFLPYTRDDFGWQSLVGLP